MRLASDYVTQAAMEAEHSIAMARFTSPPASRKASSASGRSKPMSTTLLTKSSSKSGPTASFSESSISTTSASSAATAGCDTASSGESSIPTTSASPAAAAGCDTALPRTGPCRRLRVRVVTLGHPVRRAAAARAAIAPLRGALFRFPDRAAACSTRRSSPAERRATSSIFRPASAVSTIICSFAGSAAAVAAPGRSHVKSKPRPRKKTRTTSGVCFCRFTQKKMMQYRSPSKSKVKCNWFASKCIHSSRPPHARP
mmetsp:Transcript_104525/g.233318  ORF Transcript_104525/g.233318 Transcript_104525/m.233318 type:complete len:256 (+) Transcript_104525:15-782(+)